MSTIGNDIIQGLREAADYSHGESPGYRVHDLQIPETAKVRDPKNRPQMTQGTSQRAVPQPS